MLQTLCGLYRKLISSLGTLVGIILALLAALITIEVIMRNTGLGGISWLNEVAEYFLYAGTLMAAPWALAEGAHVRVDVVIASLPKSLALKVEKIADLLGAVICFVIAYYGAVAVRDAYVENTIQYKALAMPEWILYLAVPVFVTFLGIEFLIRAWNAHKGIDETETHITSEGF
ncbi:MAG: TRAP transporter small permease [Fimbriimonadaceae bacterium]|nr:TRAP transporter small permease [Alphaproteobacteria bacterium]